MTEKLYDYDSFLSEFTSTVLSCEKSENGYKVTLDKTAFFPEGGGQFSDTGMIGKTAVFDVQTDGGEIFHYCENEVAVGSTVNCKIDFKKRFRNMQNHSGEHIISGLVHSLYSYENVGFHLGKNEVTLDFNGVLTKEQLRDIEIKANEAVIEDVPVTAVYPTKEELEKINYRSKKELSGKVRIVTVEGYDTCACCAPHVKHTGQIGQIKILDFSKYKSGVRVYIKCGFDALCDYNEKYDEILKISNLLSVPQNETSLAVENLISLNKELKSELNKIKTEKELEKIDSLPYTDGNFVFFTTTDDNAVLIEMVNKAKEKCDKTICILSGADETGYRYVMYSKSPDFDNISKQINTSLNGRGGGRNGMMQGRFSAARTDIEKYFLKK